MGRKQKISQDVVISHPLFCSESFHIWTESETLKMSIEERLGPNIVSLVSPKSFKKRSSV